MTSDIKIFENKEFGKVRTAGTIDKPLFCLADVCRVLEIQVTPTKNRLKQDGVSLIKVIDNLGREQEAIFINESNLYKTILRSDKPQAEPFQDWVCNDVLPSIRKTGSYSINGKSLPDFTNAAEAARAWADEYEQRLKLEAEARENAPKVEFFDAVAESKSAVDMAAVAKTLSFKNVGRNKLFEILRDNQILQGNNIPYQKYIDCGYFRVIEQKYNRPSGEICISFKTLVYQRGLQFIKDKLLSLGYQYLETNNK